jgi:hypothetical protein
VAAFAFVGMLIALGMPARRSAAPPAAPPVPAAAVRQGVPS